MNAHDQPASRRSRTVLLLLCGLILIHLCTNLLWMSFCTHAPSHYPHNDYPGAMDRGLVLLADYPPQLVEWNYDRVRILALDFAGSIAVALGPSYLTLSLASTIALIMLMIGCFELGRELRDEWTGLLAAALISFYPISYAFSRILQGQIQEMMWTVWLALLAIKLSAALADDEASMRTREIVLAVLLALGWPLAFLTPVEMTYVFLFWLVGWTVIGWLLLKSLIAALRGNAQRRLRRVLIVVLLGLWIAAITAVLYYPDYVLAGRKLPMQYYGAEAAGQGDLGMGLPGWAGLLSYPREMAWETVGLLASVALLPALLLMLLDRRARQRDTLLLWLIVPFVVLNLSVKKWGYYLCNVYPAMALITALGVAALRPRWLRVGLGVLLVLCGCVMMQLRSFSIDPFHWPEVLGVNYYHPNPYVRQPTQDPMNALYSHAAGLIQDELDGLQRPAGITRIGMLKVPGFGTSLIEYYLKLHGEKRARIESAVDEHSGELAPFDPFDLLVVVWPGDLVYRSGARDHQPHFGEIIDPPTREQMLGWVRDDGRFEPAGAAGPFTFFRRVR
ncbi:MAG: hypothetical protein P9M14_08195 [Candidatus Alcyoniella australis]|nr:hypothetical protein [Candidatus Alcyoniella australis]